MSKRLAFLLPIIVLMISFVIPAEAKALPNTCARWVACGRGQYYCAGRKGESCKNPSFYQSSYDLSQSIRQRAKTIPPAKKGVVYKSSPAAKYVWKYKYVYNKKGQRVKRWYQVRVTTTAKK
ncbi:MAG: hypothetical protein AAB619_02950 [Patescibacteria group bacterium]